VLVYIQMSQPTAFLHVLV